LAVEAREVTTHTRVLSSELRERIEKRYELATSAAFHTSPALLRSSPERSGRQNETRTVTVMIVRTPAVST
jgi:hypothetical protein